MKLLSFIVEILDTEPQTPVSVTGRNAWALQQLIDAAETGCTPIDNPGPRWSGYVHNLRQAGFIIDTIREPHGGPFPGRHARYVLRPRVRVLELEGVAHG